MAYPPFRPDTIFTHLLLKTGLKHKKVTLILLLVSIVVIVFGISCRNCSIEIVVLIAFFVTTILIYTQWIFVDINNQNNCESKDSIYSKNKHIDKIHVERKI